MFIPFGLPILEMIKSIITHKHVLTKFLENLGTTYYIATPEAYNDILFKRLHRFLKNQRINSNDVSTYLQWIIGILLEIYAWNVLLIYGRDIIIPFTLVGFIILLSYDITENITE